MSIQSKPADAVQSQELRKFFETLLAETFTITYEGKSFVFKKRFPSAVITEIATKSQAAQINYLISYLSYDPKLPLSLVATSLTGDFLALVGREIKKYSMDVLSGEDPKTLPIPKV